MSYKVLELIDLSLSTLTYSETKEENLVFLGFPTCYELCSSGKTSSSGIKIIINNQYI